MQSPQDDARHDCPVEGVACPLSFEQLSGLSDEELLAHLGHAHADAIAVLYQRYRRLVFGVAFQVLRDRGEAEDVVQNVFLDLYKTALRFDPTRGTAKIWILQFAYSRSFRRRRHLGARQFYSTIDISEVENQLASTASPAQGIEDICTVATAMERLGQAQRRVIHLASEGHSLRDISEVTGETLANVRHHYYRGLAKLRAHLRGRARKSSGQAKEAADATT